MKAWEEIVNKALLGSEKVSLTAADLPGEIADGFDVVASPNTEDTFLKITALVYQFRQSGAQPMKAIQAIETQASLESKEYCPAKANGILKTLLEEELTGLLEFWLRLCSLKEQLARPEMAPALLNVAQRRKELRRVVTHVAGERGKWLCSLNAEWNFTSAQADSEKVWTEGTMEERRELLRHLRNVDPEQGRKLLETSWTTEGSNEKLAFLQILKINISATDLAWLENLKEKGQKINAAIVELLKLIPSSAVVQEYQKSLSECVSVKTGKALLGMINKTEIAVDESFAFPESIFKTGIEKLSSNKKISDHHHIVAQVMMAVPPSFWVAHLQRTPAEIIELIQKGKETAFYIPAIAIASAQFRDTTWARTILDKADKDVISNSIVTLLSVLSGDEQNEYALRFFREQPVEIIQLMLASETEWSVELSRLILKFTATEVYQYNRSFYKQAVASIPVSIADQLDSFTPDDDQRKTYWQTQRDELARLLTLKQQTLQSFDA